MDALTATPAVEGEGAAIGVAPGWRARVTALIELTKPRITMLVVLTSAAGFYAGAVGRVDGAVLAWTLLGTALVAGGTSALNQVLERDVDGRMVRTRRRPLPEGRLKMGTSAAFSVALAVAGVALLALEVNRLTAGLAALSLLVYDFGYTPLKRVHPASTLVGAVPGALPILGGWTAARGELGAGAWVLFGVLFLWQLPHFLSLAWIYREDYGRADLKMLTVVDPSGRRARQQSVLYALALLPVSLLPVALGMSGGMYFAGAALLGSGYVASACRFAVRTDLRAAKTLFRTSILYLPLLLGLLALDKPKRAFTDSVADAPLLPEAAAESTPGG